MIPRLEIFVEHSGASSNNYVRHTDDGEHFVQKTAVSFKKLVQKTGVIASLQARWSIPDYTWTILTLTNISYDLDNAPKVFMDALQGVAYHADSRNQLLLLRHRRVPTENPSYRATIVPISKETHRKFRKRDAEPMPHDVFTMVFLSALYPLPKKENHEQTD